MACIKAYPTVFKRQVLYTFFANPQGLTYSMLPKTGSSHNAEFHEVLGDCFS